MARRNLVHPFERKQTHPSVSLRPRLYDLSRSDHIVFTNDGKSSAENALWKPKFRNLGGQAMPHAVPFTLSLSVWIPTGPARVWHPCDLLGDAITDELINACSELKAVFRAHGRLVARILSAPAVPRYDGFRLIGRRKDTGLLVAAVEWTRSPETRALVPFPVTWTACEYVHPEDFVPVA